MFGGGVVLPAGGVVPEDGGVVLELEPAPIEVSLPLVPEVPMLLEELEAAWWW